MGCESLDPFSDKTLLFVGVGVQNIRHVRVRIYLRQIKQTDYTGTVQVHHYHTHVPRLMPTIFWYIFACAVSVRLLQRMLHLTNMLGCPLGL